MKGSTNKGASNCPVQLSLISMELPNTGFSASLNISCARAAPSIHSPRQTKSSFPSPRLTSSSFLFFFLLFPPITYSLTSLPPERPKRLSNRHAPLYSIQTPPIRLDQARQDAKHLIQFPAWNNHDAIIRIRKDDVAGFD